MICCTEPTGPAAERAREETHAISTIIENNYQRAIASLLFGSRAIGCHDEKSDADVILLFSELEHSFHEVCEIDGIRLDVHAMTAAELRSHFQTQAQIRCCFYIKAVSEGLVMSDRGGIWPALRKEARILCSARLELPDLTPIRLSLTSRLNDLHRDWDQVQRCLIIGELTKNVMCLRSLQSHGWVARMDVMRRWLYAGSETEMRELDHAFERAISGQVNEFMKIVSNDLESIGGPLKSGERFPLRLG